MVIYCKYHGVHKRLSPPLASASAMSLVVGDYALCPSLCFMKLNLETYGSSYNKYNREKLIYLISGRQLSGQTSQKFNIEVKDRILSSYKNPRLEPLSST
jgi:hypothetical protein